VINNDLQAKPSDGLEPSTPSFPLKVEVCTSVYGRSQTGTKSLQIPTMWGVRSWWPIAVVLDLVDAEWTRCTPPFGFRISRADGIPAGPAAADHRVRPMCLTRPTSARRASQTAAADERPRASARGVVSDLPGRARRTLSGPLPEQNRTADDAACRAWVACSFVPNVQSPPRGSRAAPFRARGLAHASARSCRKRRRRASRSRHSPPTARSRSPTPSSSISWPPRWHDDGPPATRPRCGQPSRAGREQPARPPWDVDEAADSRLGRLRRRDCAQSVEGLALELAAALLADAE
jgi:hypothetical protein